MEEPTCVPNRPPVEEPTCVPKRSPVEEPTCIAKRPPVEEATCGHEGVGDEAMAEVTQRQVEDVDIEGRECPLPETHRHQHQPIQHHGQAG